MTVSVGTWAGAAGVLLLNRPNMVLYDDVGGCLLAAASVVDHSHEGLYATAVKLIQVSMA